MKRKIIICTAGFLMTVLCSGQAYASGFPYRIEGEHQEVNEEYLYMSSVKIKAESEQYAEFAAAVNDWVWEQEMIREAEIAEYMERASRDAEILGETFWGYSVQKELTAARVDGYVLSLLEEQYEHSGGAYPVISYETVNFDVQTGEILELSDLGVDSETFKAQVIGLLAAYLNENYEADALQVSEGQIEALWETGMEWYFDAVGITVLFHEGVLGPHALGIVEVPLTYAELEDCLKEEYKLPESAGVYRMKENVPFDMPEGEHSVEVCLHVEPQDYDWRYSLSAGENLVNTDIFGALYDAYYLQKENGQKFVMFCVDMASADYHTVLFSVDGDVLTQTDSIYAALDAAEIQPDSLEMGFHVNVLGSYSSQKEYSIDENGKFVTEDMIHMLSGSLESRFVLKTMVDLVIDVDGTETVVPAGSGLRMMATDEESFAIVQVVETEEIGVLRFTRENEEYSWGVNIAGIHEEQCFEMLPYAG